MGIALRDTGLGSMLPRVLRLSDERAAGDLMTPDQAFDRTPAAPNELQQKAKSGNEWLKLLDRVLLDLSPCKTA